VLGRSDLAVAFARALTDPGDFSRLMLPRYTLRPYQLEPARAIAESIERTLGRQFAVVFSRQAGKDELLAQLLAFLLVRHQRRGGNAVIAAPTFHPQAALSRDRLLERLGEPRTATKARRHDGYTVQVGKASARFLSAAPGANARGQTANFLLIANEAQDIRPDIWDAVFDPMAASTNATTLFMGTIWTRETLLARQIAHLETLERRDGIRRVWRVPWEVVAKEVPAYGDRVRSRIAQFGIDHPFIRTEYMLMELEGEGGLFPPQRLAQMRGDHPRQHLATPGKRYALLIDVAGEEEGGVDALSFAGNDRRDSTALTIVEIDQQPEGRPVYRVVDRMVWTGTRHTALHGQIVDLARNVWKASAVVVDATGIGAGLASFLAATLGERRGGISIPVLPFVFTAASKSALGWDFLALIDGGRFKEYLDDSASGTPEGRITARYWTELAATTYTTVPGPGKLLRWSVPSGRGHDDLMISAALVAALDGLDLRPRLAVGHERSL
jgi:hypothetical protein